MFTIKSLTYFLSDFSEIAYLIVGLFCLFVQRKKGNYNYLLWFLMSAGAIRIATIFLAENNINTHPYYHLLGLLELIFIFKIYQKRLHNDRWNLIVFVLAFLYVINSLFVQSIYDMNNVSSALVQLFILILGLLYMHKLYVHLDVKNILQEPFYYVHLGFLIYAGGSIFVNLMSLKITNSTNAAGIQSAWIIEPILSIVRTFFIFIGLRIEFRGK